MSKRKAEDDHLSRPPAGQSHDAGNLDEWSIEGLEDFLSSGDLKNGAAGSSSSAELAAAPNAASNDLRLVNPATSGGSSASASVGASVLPPAAPSLNSIAPLPLIQPKQQAQSSSGVPVFLGSFSPEALLGRPQPQRRVSSSGLGREAMTPHSQIGGGGGGGGVALSSATSAADDEITALLAAANSMPGPTKEKVRQYLATGKDQTLILLASKVAQKSYGNEKRFFCPPPCVYLLGSLWNGQAAATKPKVFVGIEENGSDATQVVMEEQGYAAARHLFISDSDKRKNFSLYVKVVLPSGREVGVFKSKPVKVISKPSKKKQSLNKNPELCIISGSAVSLFNRQRAHAVSTKYLRVDNGVFCGSSGRWGAFTMFVANANGEASARPLQNEYIVYGMTVVLQCTLSGVRSNPLVIRKMDKNVVYLDADEPVSQLHKVAFCVTGANRLYLALSGDQLATVSATPGGGGSGKTETVHDSAGWTIISTDKVEYTFCDPDATVSVPVTPVPLCEYVKVQNKRLVEIHGENFTPNLKVWFGDVPSQTLYRCEEFLLCIPPPFGEVRPGSTHCTEKTEVRLSLVREDGMIYSTDVTYIFEPEPVPLE